MEQAKILIVGGGIAGLTLFRALSRTRSTVELIEKENNLRADGAGITLSINAMRALNQIGLDSELTSEGKTISELIITDNYGARLNSIAMHRLKNPNQIPMIAIHRERLHNTLTKDLNRESIRTGAWIEKLVQSSNGVDVEFNDGGRGTYDLVVGADGISSNTRMKLFGNIKLRYSGYTCWRFIIDDPDGNDVAVEMWGRGKRVGVVPIGYNKTYVYCTINARPRDDSFQRLSISNFKSMFSEFGSPAARVIGELPETATLIQNDLCDLPKTLLGDNRVILLGDAAHASTPNLGQGAAMGIEDAVTLACIIENESDARLVLPRYRGLRENRVSSIRDRSFAMGKIAQVENPIGVKLRNWIFKFTPDYFSSKNFEKLLFDYDPCPIKTSF